MEARIAHFEIQGPEDGRIAAFYNLLLGWPTAPRGPGYTLIDGEATGIGGAIADAPEERIVLGVSVSDLDATVARVTELGGEVLMPPTNNGWVTKAIVKDPAGNHLSLISQHGSGGR
jgi:predicted enzyme related to lactoylglutathione lyase